MVLDNSYKKTWVIGQDEMPETLYIICNPMAFSEVTLSLNLKKVSSSNTIIAKDEIKFKLKLDNYVYSLKQGFGSTTVPWQDWINNINFPTTIYYQCNTIFDSSWLNLDNPSDNIAYEPNPVFDSFYYNFTINLLLGGIYEKLLPHEKNRPFLVPLDQYLKINEGIFYVNNNNVTDAKISATTNSNYSLTNYSASSESSGNYSQLTINNVEFENKYNSVDYKKLYFDWQYTNNNSNPIDIGRTYHDLYVTYREPLTSAYNSNRLYETCVWIGCEAARGKSTEADVFNAIWNKVKTLKVYSKDGCLLTYYLLYGPSYQYSINTTDLLLKYKDGRCDGWADLFKKTLSSQGIASTELYFIINNSSVLGYIYDNYIIQNGGAVYISLEQKSSKFQGSSQNNLCMPNNFGFVNHYINVYNFNLYDVTCGVGPYNVNDFLYYLRDNVRIRVKFNNYAPIYIENNDIILDFFEFEEL
ncbi:MAG: hypothetical protein IJS60_10315 [Abditibacteriota bacterium]|nr:hypothetical protein [Abditibacteriota bacterium]